MNEKNYKKTRYNKPFIAQRADPYVYRHEKEAYYFTASVPTYDRIVLRRGASLDALAEAEEVTVWEKHVSGEMSEHVWAPEIHYIEENWYIYFAAGEREDVWKIRPYVLHCLGSDPMKDEWEELGQVEPVDDFTFQDFSLDMTVFENRGSWYCVWAEKVSVGKKVSNLYIARMAGPTKLATEQVLLTSPDYEWERVDFWVNEGPAVIRNQGKLYLTYSASATGVCYCMGMLSIDEEGDLLNPREWKKESEPVLKTDWEKGVLGPGHNSFTESEDGQDVVMMYHARQYDEIEGDPLYDPNRHTYRMKIAWEQTGAPVFDFENNF